MSAWLLYGCSRVRRRGCTRHRCEDVRVWAAVLSGFSRVRTWRRLAGCTRRPGRLAVLAGLRLPSLARPDTTAPLATPVASVLWAKPDNISRPEPAHSLPRRTALASAGDQARWDGPSASVCIWAVWLGPGTLTPILARTALAVCCATRGELRQLAAEALRSAFCEIQQQGTAADARPDIRGQGPQPPAPATGKAARNMIPTALAPPRRPAVLLHGERRPQTGSVPAGPHRPARRAVAAAIRHATGPGGGPEGSGPGE